MKIEWNRVTWYSMLVAVVLYVGTAILFFSLGEICGQAATAAKMMPSAVSATTAAPQQNNPGSATGSSPAALSAAGAITMTSPTPNAQWTFQDQHIIQWSRASGSPGTIMLLSASTGAVVGWIEQQILSTQANFPWNTRDLFTSKTGSVEKNVAPGTYRIAIAFLSPRDPEVIGPAFSIVVPTSTITIQGATFSPSSTTITAGAKLTFVNRDAATYVLSITSKGTFTVGPSATQVFNAGILSPGTYTFYDTAYPSLDLTLTVKQGS